MGQLAPSDSDVGQDLGFGFSACKMELIVAASKALEKSIFRAYPAQQEIFFTSVESLSLHIPSNRHHPPAPRLLLSAINHDVKKLLPRLERPAVSS